MTGKGKRAQGQDAPNGKLYVQRHSSRIPSSVASQLERVFEKRIRRQGKEESQESEDYWQRGCVDLTDYWSISE